MRRSRIGRATAEGTAFQRQVRVLERKAREAGVASNAPDVPRLRAVVAELGRIHRRLLRTGGHPGLQRHITALHRLIVEVCDVHAPPPALPAPVPEPRQRADGPAALRDANRVDHRSPHQRFPEESGDSVRTLGGGLPGLGRRR
jgi:hypothetical protein